MPLAYKYTPLIELKTEGSRINLYGVVVEVLKSFTQMKSGKYHGIIAAVDDSYSGKEFPYYFRLHFFVHEPPSFNIESGSIVRAHRVKVEKYNDLYDGRVFDLKDTVFFPRLDFSDKFDDFQTTAKSISLTGADKNRINQLRNWIKNWWYLRTEWPYSLRESLSTKNDQGSTPKNTSRTSSDHSNNLGCSRNSRDAEEEAAQSSNRRTRCSSGSSVQSMPLEKEPKKIIIKRSLEASENSCNGSNSDVVEKFQPKKRIKKEKPPVAGSSSSKELQKPRTKKNKPDNCDDVSINSLSTVSIGRTLTSHKSPTDACAGISKENCPGRFCTKRMKSCQSSTPLKRKKDSKPCAGSSALRPYGNGLSYNDQCFSVRFQDCIPSLNDLMSVQSKDLVSGLCGECNLFVKYSQLKWHCERSTNGGKKPVCPNCLEYGKFCVLPFYFRIVFEVIDESGGKKLLLLDRKEAKTFFGCSVPNYLSNEALRTRLRDELQKLVSSNSYFPITVKTFGDVDEIRHHIFNPSLQALISD